MSDSENFVLFEREKDGRDSVVTEASHRATGSLVMTRCNSLTGKSKKPLNTGFFTKMLLIGRHTSNFIIVTSRAVDRCQRVKVERGRSCAGVTTRRGAVVDQQLSSVVCIIAV